MSRKVNVISQFYKRVVIFILLYTPGVSCQTFQLSSSCGGTVRTGRSCTLTCNTGTSQSDVEWIVGVLSYIQQRRSCFSTSPSLPTDYNSACRTSTNYTITVQTANYTRDSKTWICGTPSGEITSNEVILDVQVPVSSVTLTNITNNIQEISLTENSTLVLSCQTSSSYPAPTVTWYINFGMTSSGVDSQNETQANGQVITFSTITRTARRNNDRDRIYCSAENGFVDKRSRIARTNVYYGPDNGQISLSKRSAVAERTLVTLTCSTLTSVNPEVDFSWSYGDNTPITSGIGGKQGSARYKWSQTLTVTPVRDNNRQVVRCDVRNPVTSVDVETTLDLDVNYGPDNGEVQVAKSSTAIEHDPVTLTCRTTNNVQPDVTFTWTLDWSKVLSGTGSKQGSSGNTWSQTLTLTPTRNQRTVRCTVSNSLISRQDSSSVDLDVNYPPDIGISPVEGTEKADLTLRCTATGNPSIYQFEDFTQYWGNQLIQRRAGSQSGDRYDLTLSRVTYQDSGEYVCTVGNNVKQPRHRNTTVTVKGPPVTPESFRAVNSSTGSVILSWKPQYAGGDYVQEFHVEYKKYNTPDEWLKKIFPDSDEDIMLGVVDGLTANTEYVFRIMSATDRNTGNNKSPYSPEITYQTTKDIEIITSPVPASLGVGAGIGIGIGIIVVIFVVAVAVFIILKRFRGGSAGKKRTSELENTNDYHNVRNTERAASQQSEYSHLQYNANQNTYEKITHPYQNTGFEMARSDQDTDTPGNHTYVNTSRKTPGRVYENTSFTAN